MLEYIKERESKDEMHEQEPVQTSVMSPLQGIFKDLALE